MAVFHILHGCAHVLMDSISWAVYESVDDLVTVWLPKGPGDAWFCTSGFILLDKFVTGFFRVNTFLHRSSFSEMTSCCLFSLDVEMQQCWAAY